MKCVLCGNEIEETFLEKSKGTIVKIKKNDKNEIFYVCPSCQKRFKNKIKEEVMKNQ